MYYLIMYASPMGNCLNLKRTTAVVQQISNWNLELWIRIGQLQRP